MNTAPVQQEAYVTRVIDELIAEGRLEARNRSTYIARCLEDATGSVLTQLQLGVNPKRAVPLGFLSPLLTRPG